MDAISDVIGTTTSTQRSSGGDGLSQEDFFSIMISELSNQDPLEPMDNQQFLNQLVQMQSLQATTKLADGMESMILAQQISSAGALIGLSVSGEDANGGSYEGVVDRVIVEDQEVILGIGDRLAPISSVRGLQGAPVTDG